MERAAAADDERVGRLPRLHAQRQVALQLPVQPLLRSSFCSRQALLSLSVVSFYFLSSLKKGTDVFSRCQGTQCSEDRKRAAARDTLMLRLVTNLPSRPAKGLVLTRNVMRTVGSSTCRFQGMRTRGDKERLTDT